TTSYLLAPALFFFVLFNKPSSNVCLNISKSITALIFSKGLPNKDKSSLLNWVYNFLSQI
ncbi:MAG: hypothetical protein ORN85_00710, partial [Sediminibacterium sp.]|nr:hypothetical protein [Sediminibacterium sp.]